MARDGLRRILTFTVAVGVLAGVATPVATASTPPTADTAERTASATAAEDSSASQRTAVRPRGAGTTILGLVLEGGADWAMGCLENVMVGNACNQNTSAAEMVRRLQGVQSSIESTRAEVTNQLQLIHQGIQDSNYNGQLQRLDPLLSETSLATAAWTRLNECMIARSKGATTCRPYLGTALDNQGRPQTEEPAQAIDTAISRTRGEFLRLAKAARPEGTSASERVNIMAAVAIATGGASGYRGLFEYAWLRKKTKLDGRLGVPTASRGDRRTPIVDHQTAESFNRILTRWSGIYERWAAIKIIEARVRDDTNAQDAVASQARSWINGTGSPQQLAGKVAEMRLPALSKGQLAVVLGTDTKATVFTYDGDTRSGRNAHEGDIIRLARTVNGYIPPTGDQGGVEGADRGLPALFPRGRWFRVDTRVTPRTDYVIDQCQRPGEIVCGRSMRISVFALASGPDNICISRMRPMNFRPDWDTSSTGPQYWMYSNPQMDRNHLWNVYESQVKDPVSYDWDVYNMPGYPGMHFGWGAWVKCGGLRDTDPKRADTVEEIPIPTLMRAVG